MLMSPTLQISYTVLSFLLKALQISRSMPEMGRAFVHGHTFLHSWSGSMTVVAIWRCMELRSCPILLLFSSCLFFNLLLVVGMDTLLTLTYYLPTLCRSTTCCALTVLCTTRYSSFWRVTDNPAPITYLQISNLTLFWVQRKVKFYS